MFSPTSGKSLHFCSTQSWATVLQQNFSVIHSASHVICKLVFSVKSVSQNVLPHMFYILFCRSPRTQTITLYNNPVVSSYRCSPSKAEQNEGTEQHSEAKSRCPCESHEGRLGMELWLQPFVTSVIMSGQLYAPDSLYRRKNSRYPLDRLGGTHSLRDISVETNPLLLPESNL
jgi:hypothetical protein